MQRKRKPGEIELSLCDAQKIIHFERKENRKKNQREEKENANLMLK